MGTPSNGPIKLNVSQVDFSSIFYKNLFFSKPALRHSKAHLVVVESGSTSNFLKENIERLD